MTHSYSDAVASWDRLLEFEDMIEAVFDSTGFYRANWKAFRTKDGRTAAEVCRGVRRSMMLVDDETCLLADEPLNSTASQVAQALLEFYEGAPARRRKRKR